MTRFAAESATQQPVPRGRIVLRTVAGNRDLRYYAYLPHRNLAANAPALVAVHGISLNAREQAQRFMPLVEEYGVALLAPQFLPPVYRDYQRLGRDGLGSRADLALERMLADWQECTGIDTRRINLFGFSGGAQFAHRYAMAHPGSVNALALTAPGWFTFPDDRRYPYGLRRSPRLPDVRIDLAAFCDVHTAVFVGGDDVERDDALRVSERLDRQQGRTRLDRAQNWVAQMRAASERLQKPTRYRIELLPGCGHDFEQCMTTGALGAKALQFLYSEADMVLPDASLTT